MRWWWGGALAVLAAGCVGEIGDPRPERLHLLETVETPESLEPAFELPQNQLRLLPFSVRLAKLSAVLGEPTTSALFAVLRERRLELGDYDYANNIVPDPAWSASRMSLWVEALEPVCASGRMRERYPMLPGTSLGSLVRAAYGRELETDEAALYETALAGFALSPEERYLAVCRAVLSSAELVSL